MSRLTLESASNILSSRAILVGPGKYENIKVTTVTPVTIMNSEARTKFEARNVVAMVNFAAMSTSVADDAEALLNSEEFDLACENNLSLSIRVQDYLPTVGEFVTIQVIEQHSDKLGRKELFVSSIAPAKVLETTKRAFGSKVKTPTSSVVAPEMEVEPLAKPVKA
jgi:hypothetical protein